MVGGGLLGRCLGGGERGSDAFGDEPPASADAGDLPAVPAMLAVGSEQVRAEVGL
jgi:hypothetical protein